ncbi:hypothetical protein WJX77_002510 [Trebouxia sp. C0004]
MQGGGICKMVIWRLLRGGGVKAVPGRFLVHNVRSLGDPTPEDCIASWSCGLQCDVRVHDLLSELVGRYIAVLADILASPQHCIRFDAAAVELQNGVFQPVQKRPSHDA